MINEKKETITLNILIKINTCTCINVDNIGEILMHHPFSFKLWHLLDVHVCAVAEHGAVLSMLLFFFVYLVIG